MIAHFLIYVRPVQVLFAEMFQMPGTSAMSLYMFSSWNRSKHWTGAYLCLEFKRWYARWFPNGGNIIGISQWRQVAIAFARYHLQPLLEFDRAGNILDIQAAHGGPVANKYYAIDITSHPDIPPDIAYCFEVLSDSWAWLIGELDKCPVPLGREGTSEGLAEPVSELPQPAYTTDVAMRSVNQRVQNALTQLHGKGAAFR